MADEAQFVYDSKHKRDPFGPLLLTSGEMVSDTPQVLTGENVSLEGIIWDPKGGSIAIINGTIVKEGDIIDMVTIKKISDDHVVVSVRDEEKVIPLTKEEGGKDVKETEPEEKD